MANWCQNWVTFQGEESKLKEVKTLFEAMQQKEKSTNEGQKPDFENVVFLYWFFEIYTDELDTIRYDTRWSPNVDDLIKIANHFDLGFEVQFEETVNNIFGKAIYTAGNEEAQFYELHNSDFELYEFLQDEDTYLYEGEKYECEYEILETIFEKKFNINY